MRFSKFGPINTEQIMRKRLISEINSAKFRSFEFLKVSIAVFLGSVNNGIVAFAPSHDYSHPSHLANSLNHLI